VKASRSNEKIIRSIFAAIDHPRIYIHARTSQRRIECHNESDYHRDLSTALKSGRWNAVRKLGASES